LLPRLRPLFDEGGIDRSFVGSWNELKKTTLANSRIDPWKLADARRHRLVDDAVAEMSRWWEGPASKERPAGDEVDGNLMEPGPSLWPKTFVRSEPKIGRNAPCPCGSGKKFKRCCGR